ncbi:two-component system response regulator [Neptuniibacter halophilus]|uniref:two-component system response regulator n=1 Tax=Neptuniibacter halophilus TaxID=651666 RepID=UPI002572E549|nr:EAL domain-containing protein [Neptuniibacter halophilus]
MVRDTRPETALQRYRILAVDDDPTQLELVSESLSPEYDVILATSAGRALDLLHAGETPNLILLDVMMPDVSGFDFCQQVRNITRLNNVPIIFLTALADEQSELWGFNIGASDYLHKPVSPKLLKARVKAQISVRSMLETLINLNQELSLHLQDTLTASIMADTAIESGEILPEIYRDIFLKTNEGIMVADADANTMTVNPAFSRITGFSLNDVKGKPSIMKSGLHERAFYEKMWSDLNHNDTWCGEIYNQRKSGERYPELRSITVLRNSAGAVCHYISVFSDISDLKKNQEQLEYLMWHEPMTGLPNRLLIKEKIDTLLHSCRAMNTSTALIQLDINYYKRLIEAKNLSDEGFLSELIGRIQSIAQEDDQLTLASLGRDELLLLLNKPKASADTASANAYNLIDRLEEILATPFIINDIGQLQISATYGIVILPDNIQSGEEALRCVDVAHNFAKESGQKRHFYKQALIDGIQNKLKLEAALARAIELNELRFYVQPQYSVSGELSGLESLVRWQHPVEGMIPPDRFIPVAEERHLIAAIDRWMLTQACQLLTQLQPLAPECRVSVNISALHFAEEDFVLQIRDILLNHTINADRLVLEITESLIIKDIPDVISKMKSLTRLGIQFSIDDFGTGYSSLAYLKRLPFQEVKIDKQFILHAPHEKNDAEIIALIYQLADSLGVRVIAEGVESLQHATMLSERYPSMEHQGYYYSQPLPVDRWLEQLISTRQQTG